MAVEKKSKGKDNWLERSIKRMEDKKAAEPVIDERWWVIEYISSKYDSHYGEWTEAKEQQVSPYFKTMLEADKFCDEHTSTTGELKIRHQNLRRITEDRWVNY